MALERLSLGSNPVDGDGDAVTNDAEIRPASTEAGEDGVKPPRLPRWTRQEILVLIQGKRVAENRVRRGRTAGLAFGSGQVEPKWASVSSYCKRHGVNRGPVQCRKRWSNLAGDFKKIKEWESQIKDETESFWAMRNDLRRERKLPGFFDKEVYDILDGGVGPAAPALALALAPAPAEPPENPQEDSEAVFDSGRSAAAEDGLFSDFEPDETTAMAPMPISISGEKQFQPKFGPGQDPGPTGEREPATNPEPGSTSREQRKRKRSETGDTDESNVLSSRLVDVLERNSRMLSAQLEAQNSNLQLDREQRKQEADGLVTVLNKLADALGRIAEKL